MDLAIKAAGLSKDYRIYPSPLAMVKEALHPLGRKYHRVHPALQGVSFELRKGESLGVLGRNGSGKSTLLQLVCGILQATGGELAVQGRLSALLDLGAGFHPDFTGRENVYMNGAVLGLRKEDVDRRFAAIAEFADIGDFMDQPVKRYSNGMYLRLAFAAAVNADPEILVIDEVLGVGDFAFRQKCFERINRIRRKAALLLVSHNMRDVLMLCSRALVLDKGTVAFAGPAEEAADFYVQMLQREEAERKRSGEAERELYGEMYRDEDKIADVRHRWVDSTGRPAAAVDHGAPLALEFSFRLLRPARDLVVGIPIWGPDGSMITGLSTDGKRVRPKAAADGTVRGRAVIERVPFNPGTYSSVLAVTDGREYLHRALLEPFEVRRMPVHFGAMTPDYRWEFEPGGSPPGNV